MVVRMNNCCLCIPLKGGVVTITILWLVYGLYLTVSDILNGIYLFSGFGIPRVIIDILMTLGAAYGLYVVSCANTSKNLLTYTKIAYFYAAVDIINCVAGIILIATARDALVSSCYYRYTSYYSSYSSRYNTRAECIDAFDSLLRTTIIVSVLSIILSVYFALVIAAYANRRKEKEDAGVAGRGGLPQITFVQPNSGLPQTTYVQPNSGGLPQYFQPNSGPQYVQPNSGLPQYVQPNSGLPQYAQPIQPNSGLPQTTYAQPVQPNGDVPKIIYVQNLPDLPTTLTKSGFPDLPITSHHHGQAKDDLPVSHIISNHGQAKEDLPDLPKNAYHGQELSDVSRTSHHGQAKDDLPDLPRTSHHGQAKDDLPDLPKNS